MAAERSSTRLPRSRRPSRLDLRRRLAEQLSRVCESSGLTKTEVADATGVGHGTFWKLLDPIGYTRAPHEKTLRQLLRNLPDFDERQEIEKTILALADFPRYYSRLWLTDDGELHGVPL